TLHKYLDNFKQRFNVAYDLKIIGREERLEPTMEVALFRLIQEALSNVGKHAQATEVVIRLEFRRDLVSISIQDNGIGFSYNLKKMQNKSQFGLIGMQERVELLDGRMKIRSDSASGTRVMVTIPTKRSKENAM